MLWNTRTHTLMTGSDCTFMRFASLRSKGRNKGWSHWKQSGDFAPYCTRIISKGWPVCLHSDFLIRKRGGGVKWYIIARGPSRWHQAAFERSWGACPVLKLLAWSPQTPAKQPNSPSRGIIPLSLPAAQHRTPSYCFVLYLHYHSALCNYNCTLHEGAVHGKLGILPRKNYHPPPHPTKTEPKLKQTTSRVWCACFLFPLCSRIVFLAWLSATARCSTGTLRYLFS